MPDRFVLSASVGTGGTNRRGDVRDLRSRLNALGFSWVGIDGRVDADLIQAINLVQSIVRGHQRVSGDGRVDVPGFTYDWLRAENAPRWCVMPAGSRTEGYINIEREQLQDDHDYGTLWIAEALRAAGSYYRRYWLAGRSDDAPIRVNDVSRGRGHDTPDHGTHETGLAADLQLPRKDGLGGNLTFRSESYDVPAMRAQLEALRSVGAVRRILFNDPQFIEAGLCSQLAGHDDHVHVEISVPPRGEPEQLPEPLRDPTTRAHLAGILGNLRP